MSSGVIVSINRKLLNCFIDKGIQLPVKDYLFTILLANSESPYIKMNEGGYVVMENT